MGHDSQPEPIWVRDDLVRLIHARQTAEHGGDAGIRDEGLLASALARPRHRFAYGEPTPDLAELAAAYAFGLARNHAFIDGNKRTALVVCRLFLRLNNRNIKADPQDKYLTFLNLAAGEVSEDELADWLRRHLEQMTD